MTLTARQSVAAVMYRSGEPTTADYLEWVMADICSGSSVRRALVRLKRAGAIVRAGWGITRRNRPAGLWRWTG